MGIELERERYLLHTLMHNLGDIIFFKDRQHRFLRISKALADRLGLADPQQAVGKTDSDFFTEEFSERAAADEQAMMETGDRLVGKEEQPTWPDGQTSWVSTTKSPLRDDEECIVGTFGIARDISLQKQVEEKLRASERFTRLIVDTAHDAFVAMDAKSCIIDWNPQAAVTFGWSREEALGKKLAETIIPPQHRQAHAQGLAEFLQTGVGPLLNRRVETTAVDCLGREFPVELTIAPIRWGDSHIFAAFVRDITERRQSEQDLREAKEGAEAANRAKSDFLANMSHEIRTPMNAIIGMTELVLETELTSSQKEYLRMVHVSGESLLSLINGILDFSKIEAGKLELEESEFDPREFLGDTMKSLALRAEREELELACRIASKVPSPLVGDAARLRQIIVNLVGNAIKFTERGEVVLDVSVQSQKDHGVVLHFAVSDTGIGIPPDKIDTIFAAFEQADSSTTRRYGGTGLGLAIASRLVERMGGRIWVESEQGKGSTFHFTTHCEITKRQDVAEEKDRAVVVGGTPVLAVDDNETNRRILEEMLRNWRMIPTMASNARQALESLSQAADHGQPIRLVITDVHMPDIDGFDLIEQIRQDFRFARVPVVVLTSGRRPADEALCQKLEVAAHLMKPVKQSELFNGVAIALGITHAEDAAEQPAEEVERPTSRRILLAEDSIVNQKLAVGLLERQGHSVVVANNGREALDKLRERDFDLVLMDVQMPEMDGIEASKRIRQLEQKSGGHVPIVAMTAHAMRQDRQRCLAAGMDDYVAKPVRSRELFATLDRLFAGAPPVAASEPESEINPATGSVDWEQALRSVGGDKALLKEIIGAFLEETPRLLIQMREAVEAKNVAELQRAAHTLKGSLQTLGCQQPAAQARQIEVSAEKARFQTASDLLEAFEEMVGALEEPLVAFAGQDDMLK